MTSNNSRALQLLTCISLLLQWTSAQLTALITSPGNPYIVNISVTNPTQNTISVLAWNNLFDNTTLLPVPFDVKDDLGNVVPLAATNVMRGGMSSSDLYTLTPGQAYYRVVDLRQIMQDLPSGPSPPQGAGLAPKVFTIAPPPSFKGIIGDASAAIAVTSDLTSSPVTLGDLSHSNLQDITVASTPLKLSAVFPLIGDVSSSFVSPADGAHADGECAAQNLTDIANALFDAGLYAKSLGRAANDLTSKLFPMFFRSSARQTVSAIAKEAANSLNGQGPHVVVYCNDIQNVCRNPNVLGYSFTPSFLGDAYIVLCPSARALGRAADPCSTGFLATGTASHVMFHLMMTLNNVIPTVMTSSVYGPVACQHLVNSTSVDATTNPDSLAQLAMLEWGYGLGGSPYNGGSCLPVDDSPSRMKKRAVPAGRSKTPNRRQPTSLATERKSSHRLSKRDDISDDLAITSACSAAELSMLQFAVQNAQAMAKYASADLSSTSPDSLERWTTYFNGDSTVKAQVKKAYDIVAAWNTTAPYITNAWMRCDPLRRSPWCRQGDQVLVVGYYYPSGWSAMILLCPNYFYEPMASECINPSYMPGLFSAFQEDQGGKMLQELMHVTTQANGASAIKDGSPECYGWACLTQNAHDRVLPTFPNANLPENVATNYEYFAYAVRASRAECTWTDFAGAAWGALN